MRRYVVCCKLTDPSSVEGVGFELAVDDVVEPDLLPRHPGTRVIRRHQEHGEHHHHDHEPDHCRAPLTWSVGFGWLVGPIKATGSVKCLHGKVTK